MPAKNTHSNPIIQQINIGGTLYDVHDQSAVHSADDLDKLGIGHVFNFAGVVATLNDLRDIPNAELSSGDIYLVQEDNSEYVYLKDDGTDPDNENPYTVGLWFKLGGMHKHNHSATVSGTNKPSAVTVTVPAKTYSATTQKLSATQAAPTLAKLPVLNAGTTVTTSAKGVGTVSTKKVDSEVSTESGTFVTSVTPGTKTKAITALNTTTIKNPTATAVSIPQHSFADVTASKAVAATGIDIPVYTFENKTASKATSTTALSASKVATEDKTATNTVLGKPFSIPNVTGNTTVTASKATATTALAGAKVGTAVTVATGLNAGSVTRGTVTSYKTTDADCPYSASVSNGTLTLTPVVAVKTATTTAVTLPTAKTTKITPAAALSIPQYTFADVTATNTSLGDAFSVPNVTGNTSVTVKSVKTNTSVSIPQYTFEDVTADIVKTAVPVTIPQYTFTDVVASKATTGTAIEASKVTTSNVTVATGTAKSTIDTIATVSTGTDSAITSVDVTLKESTATDAITVVTDVAKTAITPVLNPTMTEAVTGVTEGAITLSLGSTGDVSVATGVSNADTTLSGSGTAAAQVWTGSVTVNEWSDSSNQVTAPKDEKGNA